MKIKQLKPRAWLAIPVDPSWSQDINKGPPAYDSTFIYRPIVRFFSLSGDCRHYHRRISNDKDVVETIENEHNQSFQLEKQEQIILFNLHKYFQQRVISVR